MYLKVASAPVVQIPSPAPGGPPAASSGSASSAGLGGYRRRRGMGVANTLAPLVPPVTLLPIGPALSPVQPYPNSATIQNLTGGNAANFNQGDSWQITITGQPNSPVTVQTQLNGAPQPIASYGSTDSNGQLVLTGTMPSSPGQWWQQWSVGPAVAGTISYNIGSAAAIVPTSSQASTTDTTASASPLSFLTDSFSVGSYSIPVWLPIAAVAGWLVLASGKKKRR